MICKKCGCTTLLEDGDLLVCPQCNAKYFDTGIDMETSATSRLDRLTDEHPVSAPEIPSVPAPVSNSDSDSVSENKKTEENNTAEEKKKKNKNHKKSKKEKAKKSKLRETIDFFIPIVIAAAIAVVIKTFILANAVVPTGSMIPTIKEKDRIIASRLAYHSDSPERYDIIMFSYPDNEKTKFVKRVIGMPGEVVTVSDGEVFITKSNGEIFKAEDSFVNPDEKPYGSSGPFYIPKKGEEIVTDGSYCYAGNGIKVGNTAFLNKYCDKKDGKYTVSENLYFVIGDNINNSMDSRMWTNKYVAEDKILGKVIFKYYPKFEKFN
ncbi:MAG: signal peptidase I [Eubacterium sp.]